MLPIWAKAFSDDCDEDTILYSIQERFSGSNSTNSDNTGYKVVTKIQKLTNFLECGIIKGAICILTSTGTILGAIEQISKEAERSINETITFIDIRSMHLTFDDSFSYANKNAKLARLTLKEVKVARPWQDSNLQPSDPKSDALSIGPQGPRSRSFLFSSDDNTDESRWDDEGEAREVSFDEGNISDSTTERWKERRMKVVDESNC
ncbi:unnamed protein product [Acanthocheilonema viteae]|uniref:Uncharacterized protein n=1 Tax=Acanthocheilonema viteae TaxID=6277 RepID=A0A498SAB2_ACAVI|nr:unnamed protein product [Acanthocheilonema viteae]